MPLGLALGGFVGLVVKDLDLAAMTPFEGSREALVVLVALAVGLAWAFVSRWLVRALCAGAMLLWCVVAFTPLCSAMARGLLRSDALEPADAVFVSFAALSPGETAAAEVRSRLLAAGDIVARKQAPVVVVPEGAVPRTSTVSEVMGLVGVGREAIIPLPAGDNTRAEAVALGRLYRERQWRLVIVVTSPLHASRIGSAVSREGVSVVVAPSPETRFDLHGMDRAADRIAAFGSVIHEQVGRVVYRLRGWI
jgi:uncharacterized SAM-binding protein YcdF (DUF218 family)